MSDYDDEDEYQSDTENIWESDEDFDEQPDSPQSPYLNLKPSYKELQNVGLPGFVGLVEKPMTRMERSMMDPLDSFRINVDAISRSLRNWDDVKISEKDITEMLESAADLKYVQYKNPTAYVLGYMASNGGKKLDKTSFDSVIKKVLPHTEDQTSVTPVDVVRYARLWQNVKQTS